VENIFWAKLGGTSIEIVCIGMLACRSVAGVW